jgi:hypothetical protein
VICGSDPNLNNEFFTLRGSLVFPIQICSIICPLGSSPSTLPLSDVRQIWRHIDHAATASVESR